jgi:hypothetical protein
MRLSIVAFILPGDSPKGNSLSTNVLCIKQGRTRKPRSEKLSSSLFRIRPLTWMAPFRCKIDAEAELRLLERDHAPQFFELGLS